METTTKKPSQCDRIKSALERGDSLTGMQILTRFNCLNYKGRISDLRSSGVAIKTEMIKTTSGKRVAQYSLV
jgi:hypothetical protein